VVIARLAKPQRVRAALLAGYLGLAVALVLWWAVGHPVLGTEIFPAVDSGQFQLRVLAPDGTPLERTEELAKDVLEPRWTPYGSSWMCRRLTPPR
jgi:multidrug efflux pump subunit AcrB